MERTLAVFGRATLHGSEYHRKGFILVILTGAIYSSLTLKTTRQTLFTGNLAISSQYQTLVKVRYSNYNRIIVGTFTEEKH